MDDHCVVMKCSPVLIGVAYISKHCAHWQISAWWYNWGLVTVWCCLAWCDRLEATVILQCIPCVLCLESGPTVLMLFAGLPRRHAHLLVAGQLTNWSLARGTQPVVRDHPHYQLVSVYVLTVVWMHYHCHPAWLVSQVVISILFHLLLWSKHSIESLTLNCGHAFCISASIYTLVLLLF